ncbi:MAG: hypothetical protein ABI718_00045 [Acidobacteriota bacterium]
MTRRRKKKVQLLALLMTDTGIDLRGREGGEGFPIDSQETSASLRAVLRDDNGFRVVWTIPSDSGSTPESAFVDRDGHVLPPRFEAALDKRFGFTDIVLSPVEGLAITGLLNGHVLLILPDVQGRTRPVRN